MPNYVNSQNNYFYREIGRKAGAGEVIELPEASYEKYKKSHPGLLKPALLNTRAEVPTIRSEEIPSEEPIVEPKKRGRGRSKK